jgi:hypothetical protein
VLPDDSRIHALKRPSDGDAAQAGAGSPGAEAVVVLKPLDSGNDMRENGKQAASLNLFF